MRSTFRSLAVGSTATLVLFITACDKTTLPPPSNNTGIPVTETFAGTLQPSGEAFYSFGMSVAGNISLTLVSVTGSSVPDDALFPIGIGLPVGTGCTASVDAAVKPGGTPQHSASRGSGFYCVRIADNARLGAAANFVLNITHPK
jgi:hypothetical protein